MSTAKQGKHKNYGAKMSNPRIKASKEHRRCGPLGYWMRAVRELEKHFTTRAEWLAREVK